MGSGGEFAETSKYRLIFKLITKHKNTKLTRHFLYTLLYDGFLTPNIMTTAIQDLISDLDKIKKHLTQKTEIQTIQLIIDTAKNKYSKKEKEQISDAWIDGYCANENDVIDSTNYFDTKFGHDAG